METLSRGATAKFDLAGALFDKAAPACMELRVELDALRTRYALSTGHLFLRAALGESSRQDARVEFHRILASEGFLSELDGLVARLKIGLGFGGGGEEDGRPPRPPGPPARDGGPADGPDGGEDDEPGAGARRRRRLPPQGAGRCRLGRPAGALVRETRALFDQYAEHGAVLDAEPPPFGGERYNWCAECLREMCVRADTSELECPSCHRCRQLIGTVFDDAQFYNQEGQKAKSGSFNPNRHFRFWMDRILAREPEEELGDKEDPDNTCGELLLAGLRNLIRRNNKILRLLGVDDVRAMLKVLGRTELNKNVPLIMKKLTGVGPPPLPEALCQRVEKLFSKAIEIGERVRPSGRTNRSYYPFYIYKILDAILPDDDYDNRRVLFYIYMQGKETLDKNDREWGGICSELPEIAWVPTDRTKAQKYCLR